MKPRIIRTRNAQLAHDLNSLNNKSEVFLKGKPRGINSIIKNINKREEVLKVDHLIRIRKVKNISINARKPRL